MWVTPAGAHGLPLYRVVGLRGFGNVAFSTPPFVLPASSNRGNQNEHEQSGTMTDAAASVTATATTTTTVASLLWVNANANWRSVPHHSGTTPPRGRGCDEGCNAYVATELRVVDGNDDGGDGASSSTVVAGYAKEDSDVLLNADGLELALTWGGGERGFAQDLAAFAGKTLQVRFYSREADIYAFGVRGSL